LKFALTPEKRKKSGKKVKSREGKKEKRKKDIKRGRG